ncbi:DNA polymerase alpha subunit B [Anthonomus grandis grandis]|uniref:DNA polymerase alpha subunit B n=1 Tax=Anthonomus grandis grandis TaxID=2921223 RepID=UPI00216612CD|nr:DNA polymerase alpha subunit B [Anthonomus grandis grandis]
MVTKENILEQFEMFNINPSEAILMKCVELCEKYNIDEEAFVEQWFAFTTSNLKGAAPTIEYLERLERKELVNNQNHDNVQSDVCMDANEPMELSSSPSQLSARPSEDNVPNTPKAHAPPLSRINTPVRPKKLQVDQVTDISSQISSPSVGLDTYKKRDEALSVRFYYGSKNAKFKRESDLEISAKPVYDDGMKSDQKFMLEYIGKRVGCMDNMVEDLAQAIINSRHPYRSTQNSNTDEIMLYGRIISLSFKRLDANSVLLGQTWKFRGQTVALDLSKLLEFSVFPGQVVVAYGRLRNTTPELATLEVNELHAKTDLALLEEPPLVSGPPLEMVIACGPFTLNSNLNFEPLHDLLKYVKETNPHVLLLIGPFSDKTHPGILQGELRQSVDSLFIDLVDTISKEITETQIIIVSSQKDPHHFPVYPTPPYDVGQQYPNITFMPDPCMVNINGLVLGATSVDVLFDMGCSELYVNKTNSADLRMPRLASHILKQQSFYPLDPPGKGVYKDYSLMERYGLLSDKPHVLVLPSALRHFVKDVDECLIINPERLVKGNGGGTFARLEITPGNSRSVCERSACQILKI